MTGDPRKTAVPRTMYVGGGFPAGAFLFFCACCVVAALFWRLGH